MNATILIVDDEENARQNIGTFLTTRGYEVVGAATLQEAKDKLWHGDSQSSSQLPARSVGLTPRLARQAGSRAN